MSRVPEDYIMGPFSADGKKVEVGEVLYTLDKYGRVDVFVVEFLTYHGEYLEWCANGRVDQQIKECMHARCMESVDDAIEMLRIVSEKAAVNPLTSLRLPLYKLVARCADIINSINEQYKKLVPKQERVSIDHRTSYSGNEGWDYLSMDESDL